jgi:hypothetical protein
LDDTTSVYLEILYWPSGHLVIGHRAHVFSVLRIFRHKLQNLSSPVFCWWIIRWCIACTLIVICQVKWFVNAQKNPAIFLALKSSTQTDIICLHNVLQHIRNTLVIISYISLSYLLVKFMYTWGYVQHLKEIHCKLKTTK